MHICRGLPRALVLASRGKHKYSGMTRRIWHYAVAFLVATRPINSRRLQ